MICKDNREFISALEKTGDIVRVKEEIDWELEAGAVVRRTNELQGPAVLFEKIKGYSSDYRIFGTPMATSRRISIAMGMPVHSLARDIQLEYERRITKPVKPTIVKNAPCKEMVMTGNDIDLYRFPAPYVHSGDGGRYLCTWHLVANQDPDSRWMNWGMYRAMIHDRSTLGCLILPYQHQGIIYNSKYFSNNKPMPFAIAIGCDPLVSMVASAFIRKGESEVDYAGALHQAPLEVVRCETNDLLVPAHAEIVIEGEVSIDRLIPEGPFGEYTGYRHPERRFLPPYIVKAITHRKTPILTMSNMGMPVDESAACMGITSGISIKDFLKRRGIEVKEVHVPAETATFLAIVSVENPVDGTAERIKSILASGRVNISKVLVVDTDIDPFNLAQVVHALSTKCHPGRGIFTTLTAGVNPLTPYLSHKERRAGTDALALMDCTWPSSWSRETDVPPRVAFNEVYPEEIKEKVVKNWKKYGFKS